MWIYDITSDGRKSSLEALPPLENSFSPSDFRQQAVHARSKIVSGRYLLPKTLLHCLRRPFFAAIPSRILQILFRYAQPVLMSYAIDYTRRDRTIGATVPSARAIVAGTAIIYIGIALSKMAYRTQVDRLRVMIRNCLIGLLHDKALAMYTAAGRPDDGRVLTLVNSDVESLLDTAEMFYEACAQVLEVLVGMALLARKVGWICLVVLIGVIGCSRISRYVAFHLKPRERACNAATQKRLAMTTVLLNAMKSIKMAGVSAPFKKRLLKLRLEEIDAFKKARWLAVAANSSANALGLFSPAIVLAIFSILARYKYDTTLDAETAFTTIAIVTMVTDPANMIMTIVPRVVASLAAFERIEEYLLEAAYRDYRIDSGSLPHTSTQPTIALRGVSLQFELNARPVLDNITFEIFQGSFVACIGPVGSGKTSLLHAIAGDLECSAGFIFVPPGPLGLCTQTAWLPAGTIRDVICGPSRGFETGWYTDVIRACCLEDDIRALPSQDETQIASGGLNLSGGQRQRVALARALYSRCQMLLLDDPFSALDVRTSSHIAHNLFGQSGLCRRMATTVFLTTNSTSACDLMDHVILLEDASIKAQGSWRDVVPELNSHTVSEKYHSEEASLTRPSYLDVPKVNTVSAMQDTPELAQVLKFKGVYQYWLSTIGKRKFATFQLCTLILVVFLTLPQYWIKRWTESDGRQPWTYMFGYMGLSIVSWIATSLQTWSAQIRVASASSARIHQDLLDTILGARLSYFFDNETGVTLNHFGQDISVVDRQLPAALSTISTQSLKLVLQTSVLIYLNPIFMTILPLCAVMVYQVQTCYLKISHVLRVLDLRSRAQVLTSFIETTEGLATIRAFDWQKQYAEKNIRSLDHSQRPMHYQLCAQRWLNLTLDLLSAGVAIAVVFFTVVWRDGDESAEVGVALSMVIAVSATILKFVSSWTNMEAAIGAVARVKDVNDTTLREDASPESFLPGESWPSKGELIVSDVQVSYSKTTTALREVNLHIRPGQKVLVCGRTGSGKSTLLLTLLRLLDLDKGAIHIDGIDTTLVSPSIIRETCFITIPQDPFILEDASLRFNIDPFGSYADDQIISTLESTHLWTSVLRLHSQHEKTPSGKISTSEKLDQPLSSFPPLTPGQLQLLSVARAILRTKPKLSSKEKTERKEILLLDEATSSLDPTAEALVHDLVQSHFTARGHTVIMIAHRVGHTNGSDERRGFDQIVWFEDGRIISKA